MLIKPTMAQTVPQINTKNSEAEKLWAKETNIFKNKIRTGGSPTFVL